MSQATQLKRYWSSAGLNSIQNEASQTFLGAAWAGGANWRVVVQEPHRGWAENVKKRLDELCQLPRGWDGYHGRAVSFTTASFALTLLNQVCGGSSAPQIVPGNRGDLQIEWHSHGVDIELHIRRPYVVEAWRRTPETDDDGETVDLGADVTLIARWLEDMQSRARAAQAAAA